MTIELIGGPLDGEIMEVSPDMRYLRIPLRSMPASWANDGSEEYVRACLDALRCGVYSPNSRPTEFHWLGEERDV